MKAPDLDKERSEEKHSRAEFLSLYNEDLPVSFPRATEALLAEYQSLFPTQFKDGHWSLDQHRKKFMDWLPAHIRLQEL